MAIALDTNIGFNGHDNPTQSLTVASGSDRLLIVGVGYDGSVGGVDTPSYNGDNLTLLQNLPLSGIASGRDVDVWYLLNPDVGTFDLTAADWGYTGSVVASVWTGVNQSTPFGTLGTNAAESNSPSVAVTGDSDGMVVDFCGVLVEVANASSPQTELNANANFFDEVNMSSSYRAGTGSSFNMVRDTLSVDRFWATIAVPLKAASGGGGGGGGAYLLENGTDKYLLEDGSGVYLLEGEDIILIKTLATLGVG
jgi:hypothetical protein